MPQPNKEWKYKKPYTRSTGNVSEHEQRYPTTKNQARRQYYQNLTLEERKIDESEYHSSVEKTLKLSTKQKKKSDQQKIKKWTEHPEKFDIMGIDDPIPEGYTLIHEITPEKEYEVPVYTTYKRVVNGKTKIVRRKTNRTKKITDPERHEFILYETQVLNEGYLDNWASATTVCVDKKEKTYFISGVHTYEGYRQKGLTPYTLRAAINWIDENKGEAEILSTPELPEYAKIKDPEKRKEAQERFSKDVRYFYASYDMSKDPTEDSSAFLIRRSHK